MWMQKFEKSFEDVSLESIWGCWENVNEWPLWDQELEYTNLKQDFALGSQFELKAKGGPKVRIELTEITPKRSFTDVTRFPGARMLDVHEIEKVGNGVRIISVIRVEGPMAWLWRRLVAQGVANGVPAQTESLVAFARSRQR